MKYVLLNKICWAHIFSGPHSRDPTDRIAGYHHDVIFSIFHFNKKNQYTLERESIKTVNKTHVKCIVQLN